MKIDLHPDHPDANAKPGDKRESQGLVWVFGENQYHKFWRAGPKSGTVSCSRDYPTCASGPYRADSATCADFDKAAARAIKGAKRNYEQALEVVRRYEAEA